MILIKSLTSFRHSSGHLNPIITGRKTRLIRKDPWLWSRDIQQCLHLTVLFPIETIDLISDVSMSDNGSVIRDDKDWWHCHATWRKDLGNEPVIRVITLSLTCLFLRLGHSSKLNSKLIFWLGFNEKSALQLFRSLDPRRKRAPLKSESVSIITVIPVGEHFIRGSPVIRIGIKMEKNSRKIRWILKNLIYFPENDSKN